MKRLAAGVIGCLALLQLATLPALAVRPDEMLADPALEARARRLSKDLRCLVCQNENIDDSDADLAHDLRVLLRERIAAGDSDEEVMKFLVSRYGEFVLLKPKLSLRNALLWGTPVLLLVAGGAVILSASRRRRTAPAGGLTAEETEKLQAILDRDN